jgi:hypothetical protein
MSGDDFFFFETEAGRRDVAVETDAIGEVTRATLGELVREVDSRMRNGDSFSSVEDEVIEPSGLSADQKSALWLYGWSFVDWRAQRREARAHIAQLSNASSR